MHGAWYWYACHASHHHHVFIIMFIVFIMMMIDHHHVHRSLIVVQSLNIDCWSLLIIVVRWLCERDQCEVGQRMVSISHRCAVVEWRWVCCCCPPSACSPARAPPIPVQYSSVLRSCRMLFVAG
nr:MAG TPA: hypothetical protein [Caudoviricetes sp.]